MAEQRTATLFDLEGLAVKHSLALYEFVRSINERIEAPSISRRANDLAQLIAQAGLLQTTAFFMSKGDEKIYKKIRDYLRGILERKQSEEEKIKLLQDDESILSEISKEGEGYALALALISIVIEDATKAEILDVRKCAELEGFKELASCMLELKSSGKIPYVESLLAPYLIPLQRLTSAFFGKER